MARGSGAPIHFSHFFDCERIDALRRNGVDVTFDAYPYMAGFTSLLFYLPPRLQTGSPAQILARLADPREREPLPSRSDGAPDSRPELAR